MEGVELPKWAVDRIEGVDDELWAEIQALIERYRSASPEERRSLKSLLASIRELANGNAEKDDQSA